MYTVVSKSEFIEAFHLAGRGAQFTVEGLEAIYEYMQELEADTGSPYNILDVIGLCCAFEEQTPEETAYNFGLPSAEPEVVRAYLEKHGLFVAETACGTFVYLVE